VVIAVLTALDKSLTISPTEKSIIIYLALALAGVLQLAHLGLKVKAIDAYTVIRLKAADFVNALPAPEKSFVDSVADDIVNDVKKAVDSGVAPTLADAPTEPIS
jgi:hypothetical protein